MAKKSSRPAAGQPKSKSKSKSKAAGKATRRTSVVTNDVDDVPTPRPIKEGVLTFFDLPGEIRNQIYGELLPQVAIKDIKSYNPLRHDGQKTSTRFMTSCRQVYGEAADILYASASSEVLRLNYWNSYIEFLGQDILDEIATANDFLALKRFKDVRLHLYVQDEDPDEPSEVLTSTVCEAQNVIFAIVTPLQSDHVVQNLNVTIDVRENEDSWEDAYHDGGWEGAKYHSFRTMIMQEFRHIKPDDISRPHMTAFLTDPLRTIRGITDGKGKNGKFSLDFIGHSGKPWQELPGQVRDLVLGDTPVHNYAAFVPYEEVLKQMRAVFFSKFATNWRDKDRYDAPLTRDRLPESLVDKYYEYWDLLCQARVRGNVKEFRQQHSKLLKFVKAVIKTRSDCSKAASSDQAELWEHGCRELVHICENLKAVLPAADTDTSFFGYNLINESLREWQEHGREEEKQAKKKRKAEKEVPTKTGKKAKLSKKD